VRGAHPAGSTLPLARCLARRARTPFPRGGSPCLLGIVALLISGCAREPVKGLVALCAAQVARERIGQVNALKSARQIEACMYMHGYQRTSGPGCGRLAQVTNEWCYEPVNG